MNKNSIFLTVIIILFLLSMAVPVSGTMATATGSGVSRGDYNTLAILEAKDTFKKSEGSQYVTPWVSIAPGSEIACNGGTTLSYRYRLLAPDGTNHDQVMYQNSYNAGNGLLLSANGHFFTKNNAVKWLKVSDLINAANKKGFAWQGPWTMEYYFGDYDCTKYDYTGYNLVGTKTFTLVDDSVAATPAGVTTAATTTAPKPVTTAASGQVPKVVDYGVSANGVGSKKTSWGTGDSGQNLVAWIKISPGSEISGGQERYTVRYRLIKPDGTAYYDNLNRGNAISFNPDGSADMIQYPVSEFLAYPGNWKVEYYIYDASTGTTTLANTQGFTIISGAGTATPTTVATTRVTAVPTQQTRTTTVSTPVVTQSLTQFSTCSGTGTSVYAEDRTMQQGSTVKIPIMVCNANDLANMDLSVNYDTSILKFRSAEKGGLNANSLFESNEASPGTVMISFASSTGVSGSASIAILTFDVIGSNGSSSPIKITVKTASTSSGSTVPVSVSMGTFKTGTPLKVTFDGGPVTSRDALAALQMAVGKIPIDMKYDVTNDGSVNSGDARAILKIVVSSQ